MTLRIYYYRGKKNFGDAANVELCRTLSGENPVRATRPPVYSVMGSILGASFRVSVWGSGVISENYRFGAIPAAIHAVRGPKTWEWFRRHRVTAPKVYGDPGILFPYIFPPARDKIYDLGIVPHYIDANKPSLTRLPDGVLKIDVRKDPATVIKNITSCRAIISSSLHGVIAADAYSIPSLWVEFSDNVIGSGFKFHDYFEAVGEDRSPVNLRGATTLECHKLIEQCREYRVDHLIEPLLGACPFLTVVPHRRWDAD